MKVSHEEVLANHFGRKEHWGQAEISSTTPEQENTAIFRVQLIRVQGKPYRTWPESPASTFSYDDGNTLLLLILLPNRTSMMR